MQPLSEIQATTDSARASHAWFYTTNWGTHRASVLQTAMCNRVYRYDIQQFVTLWPYQISVVSGLQ